MIDQREKCEDDEKRIDKMSRDGRVAAVTEALAGDLRVAVIGDSVAVSLVMEDPATATDHPHHPVSVVNCNSHQAQIIQVKGT